MFVYLSKKIAIPNQTRLHCVSWNADQGWIACGGENGLLKVLKLDTAPLAASAAGPAGSTAAQRAAATAANNLAMNQTLEGHDGAVSVASWNEPHRKLTTSDTRGLVIVWILHRGMWYEEMVNNRQRSVVKDLRWTPDGRAVCIAYEDGNVIVGSVDGARLWGKDLRRPISLIEWSPDSRYLLFAMAMGAVHLYDANSGAFLTELGVKAGEETRIAAIDWYSGADGYADPTAPTLAVVFDNGKALLMRSEHDDDPVVVMTQLRVRVAKWNLQGTCLAIAGHRVPPGAAAAGGADKRDGSVEFYSPFGVHLRSLRVPGANGVASVSWEGTGLRIALAVDMFIYFANVRPAYRWAWVGKTLVYAYTRTDRDDADRGQCVVLWNTKSGDKSVKYIPRLLHVAAGGETLCLVMKSEDLPSHLVVLCNDIGSPVDSRYVDMEPKVVAMSAHFCCVASDDLVYLWQYRSIIKQADQLSAFAGAALLKRECRERLWHIEETLIAMTDPAGENVTPAAFAAKATLARTPDAICALTLSESFLLVGRVSGTVHQYALPNSALVGKFTLQCRPHTLALNQSSARLAVIDSLGVFSLYDMIPPSAGGYTDAPRPGLKLGLERKDVWDVKWASDADDLFAIMEKTRMYIFRGVDPEEPVLSSAYLCSFQALKIRAVLLDEILVHDPERPSKEMVVKFATKSLRDTQELLRTVSIRDAAAYVEENPHPRLWRLLGEAGLEKGELSVAERAFVKCHDYREIQFVKRLRMLGDATKQQAEIAVHFKRFDEAERLYWESDRKDLAVELRMRLGDWFKVLKLVQEGGGDDALITQAWNAIGDYYADRQKWAKAVQYYSQARNYEKLVELQYVLEDYAGMERLTAYLPVGSALLSQLGERFRSVGFCEAAVAAFTKAGDVKAAVDCCVELNHWEQAVRLAEQHSLPEIERYLAQYAAHLVKRKDICRAIELYQKAGVHGASARLLVSLARQAVTRGQVLRAKKWYVLGAVEVERSKRKHVVAAAAATAPGGKAGTKVLDGLLQHEKATGTDRALASAWRGPEACHWALLCHRLLYAKDVKAALVVAMRLTEYDDVLDPQLIFSLAALCAYYAGDWACCSRAFSRLEGLDPKAHEELLARALDTTTAGTGPSVDLMLDALATAISESRRADAMAGDDAAQAASTKAKLAEAEELRERYKALAVQIFTRNPPPRVLAPSGTLRCPSCPRQPAQPAFEWDTSCSRCGAAFFACMGSGRIIMPSGGTRAGPPVFKCKQCQHRTLVEVIEEKRLRHCPLCHAKIDDSGA